MSQAIKPIQKEILYRPDIDMEDKTEVVASLVLSRGLHIVGTWPSLSPLEYSRFAADISSIFSQIIPPLPHLQHNGLNAAEVQLVVNTWYR